MEIYVVQPGDSLYSIALAHGVSMSQLVVDNAVRDLSRLAVGQTLVIQYPQQTHVVQPEESVFSIAQRYGLSVRQLKRNNPALEGGDTIYPGQTLVVSYQQDKPKGILSVNGYAYPFINRSLLGATIPYLTNLSPFTYGITPSGELVELDDGDLIAMAKEGGTAPLMHLSTLTEEGGFSNELAALVLNDQTVQSNLIRNITAMIGEKGYTGLDVDFEFISAKDADAYVAFIRRLAEVLHPLGYSVFTALAPKTSADQPGLLYEGHDYKALGAAADGLLLMTYEWGYTYGPPMAVAPLPNVERVVQYALTEIPAEKLWLGIPNYGYDWPLPYVQGQTRATSISNQRAISLAIRYNTAIGYDETAQSPWFRYSDETGKEHEVWFEDARSIRAKLGLISRYGLYGAGYWNLMRAFPQNWRVLNALFEIRDGG